MNVAADQTPSLQRDWWLRALATFQSPRAVFAAMRDDSAEAAGARQEPVTAIVVLAGIAGVLSTALAGRLLDDPNFDGVSVAVWSFLGGGFQGLTVYWLGGLLLHLATGALGGASTYRQARHLLGYAAAPLALSLILVWPVRIAVYGSDLFRSGGGDSGAGDVLFETLILASFAWSLLLLAVGVRALHAWTWPRSIAAVGLAALIPAVVAALGALL